MLRAKEILRDKHWSEADWAREAGIASPIIYRLMQGQRGIKPETLKALGRPLGIPMAELAYYIGLSDEMPSTDAVLDDVFAAEWQHADERRRKELLMILRTLNAADRGRGTKK